MSSERSPGPARDDDGVVLILVAVMMSIMLLLMSLILAGGEARRDKVLDGGVADGAVLTAAIDITETVTPGTYDDGGSCLSLVDFLTNRLKDAPAPPAGVCDDLSGLCETGVTTPRFTSYSGAGTTIEITYPVPDGHSLLGGQPIEPAVDGDDCARIGVRVIRDRTATIVTRDLDLRVRAVARADTSVSPTQPILIR